jgi:uncharacterized protein
MANWYRSEHGVITLTLHVQPGAKRSEVAGLHGDALKVRLSAPPLEGRANDALLRFLADVFDVPQRNVELKHGDHSRHKTVCVSGSSVNPDHLIDKP